VAKRYSIGLRRFSCLRWSADVLEATTRHVAVHVVAGLAAYWADRNRADPSAALGLVVWFAARGERGQWAKLNTLDCRLYSFLINLDQQIAQYVSCLSLATAITCP
jgi:hypothetical protein